MILDEEVGGPTTSAFDVAVAAVGYEQRCRYVVGEFDVTAEWAIGLEFGFLKEASYSDNRRFFDERGWQTLSAQDPSSFKTITDAIVRSAKGDAGCRVFLDISAMSREMMASVALAIRDAQKEVSVVLTIAYAPAEFGQSYGSAPIRLSAPVKPELAGWSSRPDRPLGVIMGLGCEPGLALGALQVLEPHKAWLHRPRGFDERFNTALDLANEHVADIFDVTEFDYEIRDPDITRGKIEALLNSLGGSFRVICIPFGPKIFAWLILTTVIFQERREIGIWSFSSREHAEAVDRPVSGEVVWYTATLGVPRTTADTNPSRL
jgi:hypothetical protein